MQRHCGEEHEGPEVSYVSVEQKVQGYSRPSCSVQDKEGVIIKIIFQESENLDRKKNHILILTNL